MNLDKIKKRLEQFQTQATAKAAASNIWKPPAGKSLVRIVPYTHNDVPFVELYIHFNVSKGKPVLSPSSYGEADPIIEFATKLQRTGNKEDYLLAKKLMPSHRVFAPVVVRGLEHEGVKIWGFSPSIYNELAEFISDEEIGDITHPTTGRDIQVQSITPAEAGNKFGKTKIALRPNKSVLTDSADELKKLLSNQPNIKESYKKFTYDELNDILKGYLDPESQKQDENKVKKTSETAIGKKAKSSVGIDNAEEVTAAFNAMFNEKE